MGRAFFSPADSLRDAEVPRTRWAGTFTTSTGRVTQGTMCANSPAERQVDKTQKAGNVSLCAARDPRTRLAATARATPPRRGPAPAAGALAPAPGVPAPRRRRGQRRPRSPTGPAQRDPAPCQALYPPPGASPLGSGPRAGAATGAAACGCFPAYSASPGPARGTRPRPRRKSAAARRTPRAQPGCRRSR